MIPKLIKNIQEIKDLIFNALINVKKQFILEAIFIKYNVNYIVELLHDNCIIIFLTGVNVPTLIINLCDQS